MWPESPQAKATLVAGIALALALAVFSVLQSEYFNLLSIVLFTVPFMVLSAYDIQCIVMGQCEVYSWIKTILFLITIALAFYVAALYHRRAGGGETKKTDRAPPHKKAHAGRDGGRDDDERDDRDKEGNGRGGRGRDDRDGGWRDERHDVRATGDYSGRDRDEGGRRIGGGGGRPESRAESASHASERALRANWAKLHPGVPFPETPAPTEDDDTDLDFPHTSGSAASAANGADWAASQNGSWIAPRGVVNVTDGRPHRRQGVRHPDRDQW